MTYNSTVTSKGTITLPARIRKELGITEGQLVDIELRGGTIHVTPKGGWEDVMAVGDEIAKYARTHGKTLDIEKLRAEADDIRAAEYHQKYLADQDA